MTFGIFGIVIGWIIGGISAWYMNVYGISLPKDAIDAISMPIAPRAPVMYRSRLLIVIQAVRP